MEIGVVVAALVALLVARWFAVRMIAQHRGEYVWLLLLPQFLGAAVILYGALTMLAWTPMLAAGLSVVAAIYVALLVKLARTASRTMADAGTTASMRERLFDEFADFMLGTTGLVLAAGMFAVVALAAWALLGGRG